MRLIVVLVIAFVVASIILDWVRINYSRRIDNEDSEWPELERFADRYKADVDSTIRRHGDDLVDSAYVVNVDRENVDNENT